ncbi:MAG: hypothetical protein EBZ67_11150, partial [Chitinophagia bacterium]|nr:hypothetical protein [Chitinophagia bacterium]
KLGYIEMRKRFIGRRPNTSYVATEAGRLAFARHLDGLERMIRGTVPAGPGNETHSI